LIDKAIVLRYEKVENERRLVQTITPSYKFATKSRALLLSLNSAKNFTLPCVVIEVTGIKADKERLAAKNQLISRYEHSLLEGYRFPTPIEITVSVNIITKYKSDLFQIYGKLASQFQPECFISWMVPTNPGIKKVEELRNKVEWDFNIDIDSKETLKEDDEDRFTGKMNFTIQGWLFHNHRQCQGRPILDIGTTSLVTNELENRMDGLINEAAPLTSLYGSNYKNPRQFATSHIRLLNAYTTVKIANKDYFFRIYDDTYNDFNLSSDKDYWITFDGYNLSNAKVFLVPTNHTKLKMKTFEYDENSKVTPKLGESKPKKQSIKGIEVEVVYQSDNVLRIKLPKINYVGNFDIIVYDEIDYDTFYNANGFYLNIIN
jgi:hypothetical protein